MRPSEKDRKWTRYIPFFGGKKKEGNGKKAQQGKEPKNENIAVTIEKGKPLILNEATVGSRYIIAECCHPIPGDDVLGYYNDKNKVYIHKRQCSVAYKLKTSYGNRILAAMWQMNNSLFSATIQMQGIDVVGLLNSVTSVLTTMQVNINMLHVETNDGIFDCKVEISVHNTKEINDVIDRLKQIESIKEIARV